MHPFCVIWWHLVDRGILLHHAAFGGRQEVRTATFAALAADALQRIEVAVHELEARRPHHELVVRAVLLEVTARVLRALREFGAGDAPPPSRALRPNWYVQRVIDYVQTHHGSEVKLPEISRSVGLSPYYLTTLFRRYTGHTVMNYVGEVRVRAALALLRNTGLSVTEVAQRAGYADPYYFTRVFKAREGCSPQAYRRLFQEAAEAR
jgi:AraC-like DNA-binding protein